MGVPLGTQPSKMLRTIISLIRPCKVVLLPSKCGSHLAHRSVMEWAGRMGDQSLWFWYQRNFIMDLSLAATRP
jgi:hypothetical protein